MNKVDKFVILTTLAFVGLVALRAVIEVAAAFAGIAIAAGIVYGIFRLCQTGKIAIPKFGKATPASEEKK